MGKDSQQMVLEQLNIHGQNKQMNKQKTAMTKSLKLNPMPYTKINPNLNHGLKRKIIKLVENITGKNLRVQS